MLLHLPNVHIFTMGVITAFLCLLVGLWMVRPEEQLVSPDEPPAEQREEAKVEHKLPLQTLRGIAQNPCFGVCLC